MNGYYIRDLRLAEYNGWIIIRKGNGEEYLKNKRVRKKKTSGKFLKNRYLRNKKEERLKLGCFSLSEKLRACSLVFSETCSLLVVILGIGSTSSLFPDIPEYISYLNVEFSWIVGKNLVCSEPFRAWSFDGRKLSEQRRGCSWVFLETLSSVMVLDHRRRKFDSPAHH